MKRRNGRKRSVEERREEAIIRQEKRDSLSDSKHVILLNYNRKRGNSKKEMERLKKKIQDKLKAGNKKNKKEK